MKDEEMNKSYLDNPFVKHVLEIHDNSTKNFHKRKGFKLGQNNHHLLTTKEKYTTNIFRVLGNLIETVDRIEFITVFIRRHPNKNYLWKNNIDKLTYIQYHMEVLYYKIHTILEIMKMLINEVYMLGLPSRDCSWKKLTEKITKNDKSMLVLNQFYEIFKSIIEKRHLNSHEGDYNDKRKDEINLLYGYSLYKYYDQLGIEIDGDLIRSYPPFIIDMEIKEYKQRRLKEIHVIKLLMYRIIGDFLTALMPAYSKNLKKISK